MHEHCQHELQHCAHCDVVSCTKCKQEWGMQRPCDLPHYQPIWQWIPGPVFPAWQPSIPSVWIGPITWDSTTTATSAADMPIEVMH